MNSNLGNFVCSLNVIESCGSHLAKVRQHVLLEVALLGECLVTHHTVVILGGKAQFTVILPVLLT